VWEQSFSTSRPFDVLQQDGSDTLLAHVMHAVMPQHFAAPVPQGSSRGEQLLLEQPMATAQEAADAALQQEQELLVESELPALQLETPAQLQSQPEPTPTTRQDEAAADPEQPTLLPAAAVSDSSLAAAAADEKCDRTASDNQAAAASHVGRLSELPPHVLPAVGWAPAVAVVCGVQPPWTTPLGWLYGHFRSADGFLYIVVHLLSSLL
jgi:Autophagy protein Apg5